VSSILISLLVCAYHLAYDSLKIMADGKVTLDDLKEVVRLAKLLESPVFVYHRVQTIEHTKHPFLLKSLYAVLMILP
jgi:vacuole morphology and inheritance protein 14